MGVLRGASLVHRCHWVKKKKVGLEDSRDKDCPVSNNRMQCSALEVIWDCSVNISRSSN